MPYDPKHTVFLAIPGTQETRELAIEAVRTAVARGEIPLDNWAWSPLRNEWVLLSQLPEFTPEPTPDAPIQTVRVQPRKVEPVKVSGVVMADGTVFHAPSVYSKPIEEHHEFPIFRTLFIVLGVIIGALVVVNYFLIDQPFQSSMATTSFANVGVQAHLAAFVQPDVILVHVRPSREINPDNFADLLTALTQSTPHNAIPGWPFATVSLTPAWFGQYAISAKDWNGFSDLSGYSTDEKRDYILSHLERIGGGPLLPLIRNENPSQRKAREDQAWTALVSKFQDK